MLFLNVHSEYISEDGTLRKGKACRRPSLVLGFGPEIFHLKNLVTELCVVSKDNLNCLRLRKSVQKIPSWFRP